MRKETFSTRVDLEGTCLLFLLATAVPLFFCFLALLGWALNISYGPTIEATVSAHQHAQHAEETPSFARQTAYDIETQSFELHRTTRRNAFLNLPGSPVVLTGAYIAPRSYEKAGRHMSHVHLKVHLKSTQPIAALQTGAVVLAFREEDRRTLLLRGQEPHPAGKSLLAGSIRLDGRTIQDNTGFAHYVHSVAYEDGSRWDHDPRALEAALLELEGPPGHTP